MDLDLEKWCMIRNKMLRYHFNISEEIKEVVQSIRAEMRPELIPLAEEKANFGKLVKTAVRNRDMNGVFTTMFLRINQ